MFAGIWETEQGTVMWGRRAFIALAAGGGVCLAGSRAKASEAGLFTPKIVVYIQGGRTPQVLWGVGIRSIDWIKAGCYRVHFAVPFADTNYSVSVATREDFGGNEVSVCEGNEPPIWVR